MAAARRTRSLARRRFRVGDVRVRLDPKWVDYLTSLPESGMGYQLVDIEFSDRSRLERVVVLNAELALLPKEWAGKQIRRIMLRDRSA